MKKNTLKKFKTDSLNYSHSNEDLRSIVSGLNIDSKDNVLAIAGSGDQAFAILEISESVTIVDVNPNQMEYIKKRIEFLKKENYEDFLKIRSSGARDNLLQGKFSGGYSKFNLKKRDEYFLKKGRLNRIRKNLKNFKIHRLGDILKIAQKKIGYSKIYLSNIFRFDYSINDWEPFVKKALEKIAKNLPKGGLIYISDHPKQLWVNSLELDKNLTQKARKFETTNWSPAVYKKV